VPTAEDPATAAGPQQGPGGTSRQARSAALSDARLYLCTGARRREGDLEQFLDAVLAAGVDVVQLREKDLEAAEELELLEVFADAARRHGRLLAVNDRADVAATAAADVLHVGQRDLPPAAARRLVGEDVLIGRSTHSTAQFDAAAADRDVDYACVGPTWATPTKPGRAATGLGLVRHAAAHAGATPWFAIGGVDLSTVDEVVAAGARRVVVVRAITEAEDPAAATAELLSRLPRAALASVPLAGSTVVLRRARRDDVVAVHAQLADDELSRSRGDHAAGGVTAGHLAGFAAIDADPAQLLVVAEQAGRVVGTLQLTFIPGLSRGGAWRAQVEAVRVATDLRGHGLGAAMLRWVVEEATRRGCSQVQLTSDARREGAHRFYARLGFAASHTGFKLALPRP
jgi:thiamine-phosphate pyrophosphorylase